MLSRHLCILLAALPCLGLVACGGDEHPTPHTATGSKSLTSTSRPSSSAPSIPSVGNENCSLASNGEISEAIGIPVTSSHELMGSQVGCEFDFNDGDATSSYLTVDIKKGERFDNALSGFCHDVDLEEVKLEGIGTEAYLCTEQIVCARVSPDKGFTVFVTTSARHTTLRRDAAQAVARLVAPRIS
jgi:hypothetical protein